MSEVESRMGERRKELLTDLVAIAVRVLVENEVPPLVAEIAANTMADRLADYWGGQSLTFPRDFRWKLAKIELEIYDRFTGRNYEELIRAFNMTDRGLRKLLRRVEDKLAKQRAVNQVVNQTDFFANKDAQ